MKNLIPIITAAAIVSFSSLASAQQSGVSETNYKHIDPKDAITFDRKVTASALTRGTASTDGLLIGSVILPDDSGEITAKSGRVGRESIAIVFEEDVCAIGVQVFVDNGGVRNSVKVTLDFIERTGGSVDRETRFPAGGTTNQSFTSDTFDARFAGVEISTAKGSRLAVSGIRALPCARSLS